MRKNLITYAACFGAMLLLDAIWLGGVATPFYEHGIGHLMAPQPQLGVAALFYLGYPAGLAMFAAVPAASPRQAALRGALFGLCCYGTYDLTNWATLKDWPASLALVDMAWGACVSAVAASAGRKARG
jgi:uncharacterized membrane protein